MTAHWTADLPDDTCAEAIMWAKGYPDIESAWAACERGDWMLWLAGRYLVPADSEGRRRLVLAACGCARLALRHVPAGEERPLRAIEVAEKWARKEAAVTLDDVRPAAYAADAAARLNVLRECADIIRKYYSVPPDKDTAIAKAKPKGGEL